MIVSVRYSEAWLYDIILFESYCDILIGLLTLLVVPQAYAEGLPNISGQFY